VLNQEDQRYKFFIQHAKYTVCCSADLFLPISWFEEIPATAKDLIEADRNAKLRFSQWQNGVIDRFHCS